MCTSYSFVDPLVFCSASFCFKCFGIKCTLPVGLKLGKLKTNVTF